MPIFFLDKAPEGAQAVISGADAKHISRVLRMRVGEPITLCDQQGYDYHGEIARIMDDAVLISVAKQVKSVSEPTVQVHLFQAMPKSDKMELIIQKSVELGVTEITPVFTKRCVSRPDARSMAKKLERYQKIALEAAKQSGRARIPVIHEAVNFSLALQQMAEYDLPLLFYERAQSSLKDILLKGFSSASILIGSEGGFEEWEAEQAMLAGCQTVSLGPRILRCETAPLAALSVLMFSSGNL